MKQKPGSAACSGEALAPIATRVSAVSIAGNAALSILKLLSGILAHSGAMVSDAVHSASDVFSSIIVIIGVKLAAKEADRDHPYGHERFECVAAIVLAVILAITGLLIGYRTMELLLARQTARVIPGAPALVMAAVSIVCKEAMYWYTRHYARRTGSAALLADAWHHRSDALSSVGALIGIGGARLGRPIMEPLASLVICGFILKAAADIFREAVNKMVDRACDAETEAQIAGCVMAQDRVLGVDRLQTREFGSRIYVDVEIQADGSLSLCEAHAIAESVHDEIERRFPQVKHIMVHVNPARPPG